MSKWVILAVVSLFAFTGATTAQDVATCDLDAARAKAVEELTAITNDDDESLATGLRTVSDDLSFAVAACSDLHWSGKGDTILDTVTIQSGVYKMVLVGIDDSIGVIGTNLNDDCDMVFYSTTSADNAKNGEKERREAIYKLRKDCDIIFSVDPYQNGNWEFWFERMQ